MAEPSRAAGGRSLKYASDSTFDARLISLQRQGRLTTYAPVAGQEAIEIGCGLGSRNSNKNLRNSMSRIGRNGPVFSAWWS